MNLSRSGGGDVAGASGTLTQRTACTAGWKHHLLGLALALCATVAQAATTTVDTLLDTDNNIATGCTVTTSSGNVAGVEQILRTVVAADASGYRALSTSLLNCSGASFAAPIVIDNVPRPIARGNGVAGSTAVESVVPLLYLPKGDSLIRVSFTASGSDGLSGSDVLANAAGAPITIAGVPVPIVPTLSAFALLLTALAMVGAVALARRRGYRGAQLFVVAIVAVTLSGQLIAAIVRDGLVLDWAGITALATDPSGDSPAGTDITAVYSQRDAGELAFRVDVVLNATPAANAQSATAKVGETLPVTLTGSDLESSPLTFTIVTPPTQGTLGGSGANVTYTPNASATASDSFTFRVNDGALDSPPATVSITNTRAPAITSANTTTFIPSQANSFTVLANGLPTPTTSIGVCTPALPATLTFTPDGSGGGVLAGNPGAADAGSYSCPLTASNGISPNATQAFTLVIGGAPTFTSANSFAVNEGQALPPFNVTVNTVAAFPITAFTSTAALPTGVSFSYSGAPAASATLNGTPGQCTRGSYTPQFAASNAQGTTTQNFTLTVNAVNNAPSFTIGADQTVLEDSGAQSVSDWASAINAGAPCESAQTLSFVVASNSNPSLFSGAPSVAANGTLTYTPAANANGSATIGVRIQDSGGTANGGVDTSPVQTFVINVTAVNDAPSFTSGGNVTVLKNSGAYGPTNLATAISAGPADESAQTLTFSVTANNNPGLFTVAGAPAFNAQGQLAFTPETNQFGTAQISVQAQDSGGVTNGGQNTSATVVFTITVQSAPSITSPATAVFPLDTASSFTITTTGLPDVNSITLTAIPGPGACVLPTGVAFSYLSGTTATISGTATATSSTAVNCTVTASNGINPTATQTLRIIPGTAPVPEDDQFSLLRGSASAPVGDPLVFNVFVDNGNGVDDLGVPAGAVTSFGGGSLGGTVATNAAGVTATLNTSGGITVSLAANGDLVVNATAVGALAGIYTFDYEVENAAGPATATVTLTIGTAPTISGLPPANATRGVPYNHSFTLGGFPTPTVVISGCTLPSGITGSAAGVLSGTPEPTATSTSGCIATASNGFTPPATLGSWGIAVASAAPVLTAGATTGYTEGNLPVNIDITITVSDFDSTTLASATVSLTTGFVAAQDTLSFTNAAGMGNIAVTSYVAATGVLTLGSAGATATLAEWRTALRAVSYVSSSNAPSGSRTVSWVVSDGALSSTPVTSTINLTGINSAPVFTVGGNQTVNEDAGTQTVNPWATGISDGDGGGQTLTFNVTANTNPTLFSAGPAISSTGVLTYTPAANANGSAIITITLSDNGSNVAPNANTSTSQQFTITVNAVNDAPSFTKGADQTVDEDAGAQTVSPWATAVSTGPADESAQTLTFNITGNTNAALFSAGPAISSAGVLTYTPAANASGSATITVTLSDSGSNVAPNVNTSASQQFTITVNAVNDAPSFTVGANQTVNEDAGPQTVNPWATAISAGPANESGQTVSFNVTGNTNPTLFSAGPAISLSGVLTYTPAANQNGSATITVTLSDNGSNVAPNVNTSASQQFTITVNAVNDAPVAQTKNGGNVQANMKRVGIDASLLTGVTDVDNGINGCVSTTFSVASITSGTGGTVSNVNLTTGTFDFEPTAGYVGPATVNYTVSDTGCPAPAATSAAATINLTVVGPVIWFVDDSAAAGGDGSLSRPFQTVGAATTAIGANTNQRIFVYAGTYTQGAALNSSGWLIGEGASGSFDTVFGITPPLDTIARPTLGGARPQLGSTVTLGTSSKVAGLNISSGASNGLVAASRTGLDVSEVSVTTTIGTGVSLTSASAGGVGGTVSLTSVSSNGAASGIVIQNSTGSFAVTGSSAGNCGGGVSSATPPATVVAPVTADCTGGSILSSTGAGVSLINASNVSLTRMRIANGADDGIRGDRVNGFTLASSLVESNGTVVSGTFFNNLDFGDDRSGGYASGWVGLTGTASITNSTIRSGSNNNILIRSRDTAGGTLNLTMTGSVISGNPANAFMNDGVLMESGEVANMNVTVTGNYFSASKGDHFQMAALNSGDFNVTLRNNTFEGGHSTALGQGVTLSAATGVPGYNGSGIYDVDGNVFNGAISNSVAVVLGTSASSASFVGKVRNNTIGTTGVALSCSTQAAGVYIDARGNGTHTSAVTNNIIRQCFDRGMLAEAGDGDSVLNLTVTGNTIDQQVDAGAREAIQTNFGITTTNVFGNVDTPAVCLQLGGAGALANTLSHGGGAPDDFRLRKRHEATVRLPGYVGGTDQAAGSLAAVVAFIRGQNTGSAGEPGSASASGAGGGYTGGAACPTPP
jgi:large repetitive protein